MMIRSGVGMDISDLMQLFHGGLSKCNQKVSHSLLTTFMSLFRQSTPSTSTTPLLPTSTVISSQLYPCCSASSTRSVYHEIFLSLATSKLVSKQAVSSMR